MNAVYFYCNHRYTKSPSSFTALPWWVWTPLRGVPSHQGTEPTWTDLLIRDHLQQRQTLTSLVLLPAFFCSFSCYKTRKHLSKWHNNGQSCYLHLRLKPKSGLRKNEDVKLFSECRTKWWNDPWVGVHKQECLPQQPDNMSSMEFHGSQGAEPCSLPCATFPWMIPHLLH